MGMAKTRLAKFPPSLNLSFLVFTTSDHSKSKACLFFPPYGQVTIKFQQLLWTTSRKSSFPFLTLLVKLSQIFGIFPTYYHSFFASLHNSSISQLIKLMSGKFYFVPSYESHHLPLQVSSVSPVKLLSDNLKLSLSVPPFRHYSLLEMIHPIIFSCARILFIATLLINLIFRNSRIT